MNSYRYLLILFSLLMLAGCGSTPPQPKSLPISERSVQIHATDKSITTIEELDQLTRGFADRYFMMISSAVDSIKRDNPDPGQRRTAHRIKLNGMLAVNDIVSSNDPYSQVLDLVVAVTLQSIVWIDDNVAEQVFGERAWMLIGQLHQLRKDVWDLAARVLKQDQLELLEVLILEWRLKHPQITQVEFVKFDNFSGARASGLLNELKAGGGFLAPIKETVQELREYRRLAERGFWYSKRVPSIAGIQMEAATNEILAAPEIGNLIQTLDVLNVAADRIAKTVEALPSSIASERKALFAEIDKRKDEINSLIENVSKLVRDVTQLVQTLQDALTKSDETMQIADGIVGKYYDPKASKPLETASKPFDIKEYTPVMSKLNEIVIGLNELTRSTDVFMRSKGWQQGLLDVSQFTDRRIDRIFRNIYLAIGLMFFAAVAYRFLSVLIIRRTKRSGMKSESEP